MDKWIVKMDLMNDIAVKSPAYSVQVNFCVLRLEQRCLSPVSEFDCSSFPLKYDGECVKRQLVCDGFSNCENGADESPEICANYYDLSEQFTSSPEWLYILLLGFITLFCTTVILFCCFRNYSVCGPGRLEGSTVHHLRSDGIAEASILLPPHLHSGTHVEVLSAVLVKAKFRPTFLVRDAHHCEKKFAKTSKAMSMSSNFVEFMRTLSDHETFLSKVAVIGNTLECPPNLMCYLAVRCVIKVLALAFADSQPISSLHYHF
ncbi:hypothetical protein ANCCAN_21851, partial [Ancylostoma caninum]